VLSLLDPLAASSACGAASKPSLARLRRSLRRESGARRLGAYNVSGGISCAALPRLTQEPHTPGACAVQLRLAREQRTPEERRCWRPALCCLPADQSTCLEHPEVAVRRAALETRLWLLCLRDEVETGARARREACRSWLEPVRASACGASTRHPAASAARRALRAVTSGAGRARAGCDGAWARSEQGSSAGACGQDAAQLRTGLRAAGVLARWLELAGVLCRRAER